MDRPWAATKEQVFEEVNSTSTGLPEDEAQKRLAESGPNRLVKPREKNVPLSSRLDHAPKYLWQ